MDPYAVALKQTLPLWRGSVTTVAMVDLARSKFFNIRVTYAPFSLDLRFHSPLPPASLSLARVMWLSRRKNPIFLDLPSKVPL